MERAGRQPEARGAGHLRDLRARQRLRDRARPGGGVGRGLAFHQPKNEQSMVHAAIGYARANNLLSTLACSASIGPGSTNLLTGAATATVNRVPVLLLPSDTFSHRRPDPVMQALEHPQADLSARRRSRRHGCRARQRRCLGCDQRLADRVRAASALRRNAGFARRRSRRGAAAQRRLQRERHASSGPRGGGPGDRVRRAGAVRRGDRPGGGVRVSPGSHPMG